MINISSSLCQSLVLLSISHILSSFALNIDAKGYIAFCPCMGRFGNQADQFLGALGFAHGLDRTLILPPWVEYRRGVTNSIQIPFKKYFKIEPLREYHRVIAMEEFMVHIAPTIWPPNKRTSFCFMARRNASNCQAKHGNPFGPFWDTFNVDFVNSELYGQQSLTFDVYHQDMGSKWNSIYPPEKWPVLAFTGAPGSFPVAQENVGLHKYLEWSHEIESKAKEEIKKFPRGPFIAIHLRNGIDWGQACQHVNRTKNLFASPQCLGYREEFGSVTMELCFPSKETIVKQLKRTIRNTGATSVFVASDSDHMIGFLTKALSKLGSVVSKMANPDPHVELAVMGMSNHFIGNCVSSFTAFAKRERDVNGFPSSFWAFPLVNQIKKYKHTEL